MDDLRVLLAEKSPEEREHFLTEVPRLLAAGGQFQQLSRCLTNFDFLEAKINYPDLGVQALIADYDLIDAPEASTNSETVKALKLIQGALLLSAHVLAEDKTQLAGQLLGRLLSFPVTEIQELLAQAKQKQDHPWLRPLTASLTPPGGRLLRILVVDDPVSALAVTPDGKRVISYLSDNTLKVWDLAAGKEVFTEINGSKASPFQGDFVSEML